MEYSYIELFCSISEEDQFFVYKDSPSRNSPTDAKTEIKVDGTLGWNELQMVMSRSTTPDLIKMFGKLQDFFSQQQRSGMHAFSAKRSLAATSSFPLTRSGSRPGMKREFLSDEKRDETTVETQNDGEW